MAGRKNKGRGKSRPFIMLHLRLFDSEKFVSLSDKAKLLLITAFRQYKGHNNGDICLAKKALEPWGWGKSNDTLSRAKRELECAGLLIKTRQGGLHQGPDLYALAWEPIDECGGKLDIGPTTKPLLRLTEL